MDRKKDTGLMETKRGQVAILISEKIESKPKLYEMQKK